MKVVRTAVGYAAKGLSPDLTLLLDLDVRLGLARVKDRGRSNRLDREQREFHQRVRVGYLRLARLEPGRIKIVEAAQSPQDVAKDIQKIMDRYLGSRRAGK
jgi:dTMP kinase